MGNNPRPAFVFALALAFAAAAVAAVVVAFAVPLLVLFHPNRGTVISTEAAHALVSSAVEKSASPPPPLANRYSALAVVPAFAVVSAFAVASEIERGFSPASKPAAKRLPLCRRRGPRRAYLLVGV
jgi:hypothetical protein